MALLLRPCQGPRTFAWDSSRKWVVTSSSPLWSHHRRWACWDEAGRRRTTRPVPSLRAESLGENAAQRAAAPSGVQEGGGNNACWQNDGRNRQISGSERGAGGGHAVGDAAAGESGLSFQQKIRPDVALVCFNPESWMNEACFTVPDIYLP